MLLRSVSTRSDTKDWFDRSWSTDNGATWGETREESFIREVAGGVERNYALPGYADPVRDRYVEFSNFGDRTCRPIRTSAGRILLPVQISPLGPDGEYHNPGGGYTYHDSAFVIGTWRDDDTISWDLSERIVQDPRRSTRGAIEPWRSAAASPSDDPFHSPSSCSQLFRHSNGTVYWIGNITPQNSAGNRPRYPLVVGEVDPETHLLRRDTLCTVDDRGPGESEETTLSNLLVDEDRETGELLVFVPRLFTRRQGDWTADTVLHRLAP